MPSIKDDLKYMLLQQGMNINDLVDKLNKKNNTNQTVQNLYKKLSKGTIRYAEIIEILNLIDCDIVWLPRSLKVDIDMRKTGAIVSKPVFKKRVVRKNKTGDLKIAEEQSEYNVNNDKDH